MKLGKSIICDFIDHRTACCMSCDRAAGCCHLMVHRSYFVNPFVIIAWEAFGFNTLRFKLVVLCCFYRKRQGWCRSRLGFESQGSEVDQHRGQEQRCCFLRKRLHHRMRQSLRLHLGCRKANWTWYLRCTSYFLILCLWNCICLSWLALCLACLNRLTFSFAKDFATQFSTYQLQKPMNSAGQPQVGSFYYLALARWTSSSSCYFPVAKQPLTDFYSFHFCWN